MIAALWAASQVLQAVEPRRRPLAHHEVDAEQREDAERGDQDEDGERHHLLTVRDPGLRDRQPGRDGQDEFFGLSAESDDAGAERNDPR